MMVEGDANQFDVSNAMAQAGIYASPVSFLLLLLFRLLRAHPKSSGLSLQIQLPLHISCMLISIIQIEAM